MKSISRWMLMAALAAIAASAFLTSCRRTTPEFSGSWLAFSTKMSILGPQGEEIESMTTSFTDAAFESGQYRADITADADSTGGDGFYRVTLRAYDASAGKFEEVLSEARYHYDGESMSASDSEIDEGALSPTFYAEDDVLHMLIVYALEDGSEQFDVSLARLKEQQ